MQSAGTQIYGEALMGTSGPPHWARVRGPSNHGAQAQLQGTPQASRETTKTLGTDPYPRQRTHQQRWSDDREGFSATLGDRQARGRTPSAPEPWRAPPQNNPPVDSKAVAGLRAKRVTMRAYLGVEC